MSRGGIMKKSFSMLILFYFLIFIFLPASSEKLFSQEKKEGKRILPPKIAKDLEEGIKNLQSNGVFNISFLNAFYFPAQMQKTFTTVIFRAELLKDFEELKKGAEEKKKENQQAEYLQIPYYKFYMQILTKKEIGLEAYHEYYSPLPFDGTEAEYYSFGIPLDPGEYIFAVEISRNDMSNFGTAYFKINVPSMISKEMDFTPAFFIKDMKSLPDAETLFTVHDNCIVLGKAIISPYITNKFKVDENPTLFFYILGAEIRNDGTTNIEMNITIRDDKKDVLKYTPVTMDHPIVAQPMIFKTSNFSLQKGSYVLEAMIKDKVSGKEKLNRILFEIVE